jgi:hypothetical protein
MWDTTALTLKLSLVPQLRTGALATALPGLPCSAALAMTTYKRLSLKEIRMKSLEATNVDKKSVIRGPTKMGEALRQLLVPAKTDFRGETPDFRLCCASSFSAQYGWWSPT